MKRTTAIALTETALRLLTAAGATVKFAGKAPSDAQLLAGFVRWMVGNVSVNITLKARKRMSKGYGGHAVKHGKSYEVHFLSNDLRLSLVLLAHEITHVLQYERGDLKNTRTHIVWEGKPYITVEDYNNISQPDHAKLPWEIEASKAEGTKPNAFIAFLKGASADMLEAAMKRPSDLPESISEEKLANLKAGKLTSIAVDKDGSLRDGTLKDRTYLLVGKRTVDVEGLSLSSPTLHKALVNLVKVAPHVAKLKLRTDSPSTMTVEEFLSGGAPTSGTLPSTLYHGTSSALWEKIKRTGLKPRGRTGVPPSFGQKVKAPASNPNFIYLATKDSINAARFAARDAADRHGGHPVVLSVSTRDINAEWLWPDEDSRGDTWADSIESIGTIAYNGVIKPTRISLFERTGDKGWVSASSSSGRKRNR